VNASLTHILILIGKRSLTFLLLLALVLQSLGKVVVIAGFYADQDYIVRNLCENRNKPIIHCGGKCQLNKRLKQQDKDSESPDHKPENKNEVISSRSFYLTGIDPSGPLITRAYSSGNAGRPVDRAIAHFHPPDC